ncbi:MULTISPECIES: hypothetical protein [Flavobacterium]|jgi:hypothetical protein|uniref:hypothetical protein n=1 Tax=Flavobacterium TaxID=237 RepID=UPI00118458B5|nr:MULTISPECIES: hypothetical protein [Flavobacterium]MCR4032865.1 hypothetical protein [Flavobacterium panacis]
MSDFLQNFQNDLKENVNGFIAVSVTEVETGMSYCSLTVRPDFDPELASAYNLEVVKAKLNALRALGLNQKINDILITLTDQIHIIDVSEDGRYFIYLAVDSTKANLGLTRATLSKYKKDITSKL